MTLSKPIMVLLAEDHMVVREGLRKLLEDETDICVTGEATTGREAVTLAKELRPDVIVMDIAMPKLNGMEATRHIRQENPAARVIILSAHRDDAYVEYVMELGARGYLIKQTSAHALAQAIREVHQGKIFFSPEVARRFQQQHQMTLDRKGRATTQSTTLSRREAEVLQLIAEGYANKQIAGELGISIKTVEKHRDHLMQKLSIHDTAGLTRYAVASGAIESSVQPTTLDG